MSNLLLLTCNEMRLHMRQRTEWIALLLFFIIVIVPMSPR